MAECFSYHFQSKFSGKPIIVPYIFERRWRTCEPAFLQSPFDDFLNLIESDSSLSESIYGNFIGSIEQNRPEAPPAQALIPVFHHRESLEIHRIEVKMQFFSKFKKRCAEGSVDLHSKRIKNRI